MGSEYNHYRKQFIWGDIQIAFDIFMMLIVFTSVSYWLKPSGPFYLLVSGLVMLLIWTYRKQAAKELRYRIQRMKEREEMARYLQLPAEER